MKSRVMNWTMVLALAFGVGVVTSEAQDHPKEKDKAIEKAKDFAKEKLEGQKPGDMPSEEEMKKMMEEMAALAPEHENLKKRIGKWDVSSTWTAPDGTEHKSTGTVEYRPILGGRFIVEDLHAVNIETKDPFDGYGIHGYDKTKGKYVGTWMDSMCTSIWNIEGTADASGRVFTSYMEGECPMTKEMKKHKMVTEIVGEDKMVMKMWEEQGGKEVQTLEVTYTRKS